MPHPKDGNNWISILSDHLFDLVSIFKCHTQRMEIIEFPDAELYAKPFEKRCIKKKIKYSKISPSCNWAFY